MPQTDPDLLDAILDGACGAPFDVLGIHPIGRRDAPGVVVRAFLPDAVDVAVVHGDSILPMTRLHPEGFFELVLPDEPAVFPYQLTVTRADDKIIVTEDPYRFLPALTQAEVERLDRGEELRLDRKLGAQPCSHQGVEGVRFAVWAPHARAVGVMGSFNRWEGRRHPMRRRGSSGIWELFVPGLWVGALYKYEILTTQDGQTTVKTDPVGFETEVRPATASIVADLDAYEWGDQKWMKQRAKRQAKDQPISIYEVHLGSWRRAPRNSPEEAAPFLSYEELALTLIPYVKEMGFTHVELLPVTEHPFDGSWGYQTTGYFAPTSRYGRPDEFRGFVDAAHRAGIGVILDWVPGHFPKDAPGLGYFDGTHLYEHSDPRRGVHPDWGTYVFNYELPQVNAFLIASALFWIERYHVDGLRVDAVASMLYLNYSRKDGEWIPNKKGGRENLEAAAFLRRFNEVVHAEHPGVLTFAEESTQWPGVTAPVDRGGLGFDFKWNMGWMNDTLAYMKLDPLQRKGLQKHLTFSLHYAFTEKFLLPLSHDEVVHGKRSLASKMPGTPDLQLQNVRAMLCWQFFHPGKKLLFMGAELGQWREWNFEGELEWALLDEAENRALSDSVKALNELYRKTPALHAVEDSWDGFEWIDFSDAARSVITFVRRGKGPGEAVVVALNFTPVEWQDYPVGVPEGGRWRVVFDPRTGKRATSVAAADDSGRFRILADLPPLSAMAWAPASARKESEGKATGKKTKSGAKAAGAAKTRRGDAKKAASKRNSAGATESKRRAGSARTPE